MKVLSDFDGVLTDQTEEAHEVRKILRERLVDRGRLSPAEADDWMARAERELERAPREHGWRARGRVSAYADEDLFIRNNGLASCLDGWAQAGETRLASARAALAASGLADFAALANHAYVEMAGRTRAGLTNPLDPASVALLRGLVGHGARVVVVSNSGTDRILDILRRSGVKAVAHEGAPPDAPIRVRGGARKFELAETPAGFDVAGYRLETARPYYEAIVREERPDVVIGDVFSLDLAVPLHLARTEPARHGGVRLFLRVRPYTPAWARDFFASGRDGGAARLHVLERLEDLPGLIGLT